MKENNMKNLFLGEETFVANEETFIANEETF